MFIAYKREVVFFLNYCSGIILSISDLLIKILMCMSQNQSYFINALQASMLNFI